MGVAVVIIAGFATAKVGAVVAKKYADCQCCNTLPHLVSTQLYLLQLCPKYCP